MVFRVSVEVTGEIEPAYEELVRQAAHQGEVLRMVQEGRNSAAGPIAGASVVKRFAIVGVALGEANVPKHQHVFNKSRPSVSSVSGDGFSGSGNGELPGVDLWFGSCKGRPGGARAEMALELSPKRRESLQDG